jgi:hypothetical protein
MKIFLSVVSYRDDLLRDTVASALDQADHADQLAFGIIDQSSRPAAWARSAQFVSCCRYLYMHHRQGRGPCWARSIAAGLWQGEQYFLQIDAHMLFDPSWDTRLIDQLEALLPITPRAVLSTYPPGFTLTGGKPVRSATNNKTIRLEVAPNSDFVGQSPVLRFRGVPTEREHTLEGFHVGAGCLFTRGFFLQEIPPDPFLYFEGEEQNIAIRAWTHGWQIFHPPAMPISHLYNTAGLRPVHWSEDENEARVVKWQSLQGRSNLRMQRLLFDGEYLGAFGLGRMRTLNDFAKFSGIDYPNRRIDRVTA